MDVTDDGDGFDPAPPAERRAHGHFGLRLVHDLVADAGGEMHLSSSPGDGTTMRVELPR
jgi:two-component system NarL family sensor kinase